jgi:hypothetical protein
LAAAIGMVDQAGRRLLPLDGHGQGCDGQFRSHVATHRPADDFAAEEIEHDGQIEPPLGGWHVGVSRPRELRPRPLAEPDVIFSDHPAPIIQRLAHIPISNGQRLAGTVAPIDQGHVALGAYAGQDVCICASASAPDKRSHASRSSTLPIHKSGHNIDASP